MSCDFVALNVSVMFGRRDAKVRKSVERIFNIWQERSVYPEELITELKANLQKKETVPPSGKNITMFKKIY